MVEESKGTLGLWKREEEKDDELQNKVDGEVFHDGIGTEVEESKCGKTHPINGPLSIHGIVVSGSEGFDSGISRIDEANQVTNELSTSTKDQIEGDKGTETKEVLKM